MLLAIDTYYGEAQAKTVGITFNHWADETESNIYTSIRNEFEEYIPGEFYKRELPCILDLLQQVDLSKIDFIIVDGFVFLSNDNKPGLGHYLYKALDEKIPAIGVAKRDFHLNDKNVIKVFRGKSTNPILVSSAGMAKEEAAHFIKQMHGEHRIPTLLKRVDRLTRE